MPPAFPPLGPTTPTLSPLRKKPWNLSLSLPHFERCILKSMDFKRYIVYIIWLCEGEFFASVFYWGILNLNLEKVKSTVSCGIFLKSKENITACDDFLRLLRIISTLADDVKPRVSHFALAELASGTRQWRRDLGRHSKAGLGNPPPAPGVPSPLVSTGSSCWERCLVKGQPSALETSLSPSPRAGHVVAAVSVSGALGPCLLGASQG